MGNRMYTKEDCTVFSYDGDTSILNVLGQGTIDGSIEEIENKALLDDATNFGFGAYTYRVDAELACEDDEATSWWTRLGGSGTLTITTDTDSLTGTFGVVKATKNQGDAMRWNVTLRNKGTVTIS